MRRAHTDTRLVDKYTISEDGCWIWEGNKFPTGYGIVVVRGIANRAEKYSFESEYGTIEYGEAIRHSHKMCPKHCINPEHLETFIPAPE